VSVVRRSQPDIGSSSRNRFQIDGDVVQARGVRLALDPSIAALESSLLGPLLAAVNLQPDTGQDDRGRRLPTAQSDRNVLGESGGHPNSNEVCNIGQPAFLRPPHSYLSSLKNRSGVRDCPM
jgi:hypothetical protein